MAKFYTYLPECPIDEIRFLGLLIEKNLLKSLSVRKNYLTAIEVDLPIEKVAELANSITDCHRIVETLTVWTPKLTQDKIRRRF